MNVLVTGATGYIGSAVADALQRAGHHVLGVARSDTSAAKLTAAGHTAIRADARDPESIASFARKADATIHLANTAGADNAEIDPALARSLLGALDGTHKPFVYTSGVWTIGRTGDTFVDETARAEPLAIVAWRPPVERAVLDAAQRGVRSVVISPAVAHGRGGGIASMLVAEARARGRLRVVEGGHNDWTFVHVDDLADLYVRALDAPAGSLYYGAAPGATRMRDVAAAASVAGGAAGKLDDWPLAAARAELGPFADALATHQRVSGRKAERELGWHPRGMSVIEELLHGSYTKP